MTFDPAAPSLLDWLAKPWPSELPFEGPNPLAVPENPNPSRLQVYAALIGLNHGSMYVNGYGVVCNGGLYGRFGLFQQEAFCLMTMGAFIDGWLTATAGAEKDQLFEAIETEHKRVIELFDKRMVELSAAKTIVDGGDS